MARKGKIASLPRPRRDELNRRLARNEDDATLLDWLNAAADVKALLARDFAGEPVSQQNLHEWCQAGFLDWQTRQNLFAEAAELTDANGEWDALAGWNGGDDAAFRVKLRDLRRFNQDLAVLRRYNQTAARLKMQQLLFYREEKQCAATAANARKPSGAGARLDVEHSAPPRREAAAALKLASANSPRNPATKNGRHPAGRSCPLTARQIRPVSPGSPGSRVKPGKTQSNQNLKSLAKLLIVGRVRRPGVFVETWAR